VTPTKKATRKPATPQSTRRRTEDRREKFIAAYLITLNATKAAEEAGYSAKTARQQGTRLLSNAAIRARIDAAQSERAKRSEITADRVIREVARLAFSDMRKFARWGAAGVRMNESTDLTDDEAAAVAEVSETVTKDGGSQRFKLHDKAKALELLGRHFGLFPNKHEITDPRQALASMLGLVPDQLPE
jgi:phage terminase small subunit